MKSLSKRYFFFLLILVALFLPNHAHAASGNTKYANCNQLKKVWPKGVASSISKARLQPVRPSVNASVYSKNRSLDTDRDGTACESRAPKVANPYTSNTAYSPVITSPPETTPEKTAPVAASPVSTTVATTIARYLCPVGTWKVELTGLRVTLSFPSSYAGFNYYLFDLVGTFTNSTNAVIFPNNLQAKVAFTPNPDDWTSIYPTSPALYSVRLNESMEVAAGASARISGSGTIVSSSAPTLAGHDSQVMWNDPRNVAFCVKPVQG
jgi:hypothetical protein